MKFSTKDFFSKYDQIYRKMLIWSHLLKKSSMENFIFCVVWDVTLLFDFRLNLLYIIRYYFKIIIIIHQIRLVLLSTPKALKLFSGSITLPSDLVVDWSLELSTSYYCNFRKSIQKNQYHHIPMQDPEGQC